MNPRLSRAPIPEEMKGEPMPRSLNCLSTPTVQLAHTNGCQASAMLSRRMSRCNLPSGKSDNRRMKPSTIDHHLSSQGFSGKLPENDVGRTALAELTEVAEKGKLDVLHTLQLQDQSQRAGRCPDLAPMRNCGAHNRIKKAPHHGESLSHIKACVWQPSGLPLLCHSAAAWPKPLSCRQTHDRQCPDT